MEANLKMAFRDSQMATRPYVLVNPLLAKHIPVKPSQALAYFTLLGKKVAEACSIGERVLVIGFAETATAVGVAVAGAIENATYVHTSREKIPTEKLVAEFKEEHSHAKNQALYLDEEFRDLNQFDRIVFVEDEITTGKTILNFLACVKWTGKTIVSALVFNSFDESVFSADDTLFVCLQKTGEVRTLAFNDFPNPRSGVKISQYDDHCRRLATKIIAALNGKDIVDKDVLVVGTEEFMYPALYLGREIEGMAKTVMSHSTTRSPLLPQSDGDYPLKTRNSFASVYDRTRTTYLYNLKKYDTVIVITDADGTNYSEFLEVVRSYGNQMIYLVRIRNEE